MLDGDRMAKSLYQIKFRENLDKTELCTLELDKNAVEKLSDAVEDQYYFEFVVDDLPLRNFLGQLEEGSLFPHSHKVMLWTHYHFSFEYNDREIISANVSVSAPYEISSELLIANSGSIKVPQTYSISWTATDVKYEDRQDRFKVRAFFPVTLEIHWLSVLNSTILAFLLVSFVTVILARIVKKDFARYSEKSAGINISFILFPFIFFNC